MSPWLGAVLVKLHRTEHMEEAYTLLQRTGETSAEHLWAVVFHCRNISVLETLLQEPSVLVKLQQERQHRAGIRFLSP